MSVGKALEDFTDFVGRILGVYKDINTFGQVYQGLGSLVPKTPDFPLPESVEKYLKEDVPVRNVPPVTQGTSPQLGPSRQGAVLSQGGFFRTPTQKTSKSMQAGRYSEGGSARPTLTLLEEERPVEQTMTPEEQYGVIKAPDSPLMAKAAMMFRDVERSVKGSPAEFLLPGGGIATVLERKAYGEDPSLLEYGMAALDTADFVPVGKMAIFAGAASTSGMKKIRELIEREQAGQTPEQIFAETDTFRSPLHGRPQFEIDNTGAKLREDSDIFNANRPVMQVRKGSPHSPEDIVGQIDIESGMGRVINPGETFNATERYSQTFSPAIAGSLSRERVSFESKGMQYLEEILDHPELYREYPTAKRIKVEEVPLNFRDRSQVNGLFDPVTETIYLNSENLDGKPEKILPKLFHELQHWVQTQEGFPAGDSPRAISEDLQERIIGLRSQYKTLSDQTTKFLNPLVKSAFDSVGQRKGLRSVKASPEVVDLETNKVAKNLSRLHKEYSTALEEGRRAGTFSDFVRENAQPGDFGIFEKVEGGLRAGGVESILPELRPIFRRLDKLGEESFELSYQTRLQQEKAIQDYSSTAGEYEARIVEESSKEAGRIPPMPAQRLEEERDRMLVRAEKRAIRDKKNPFTTTTRPENIRFAERFPPTSEIFDDFGNVRVPEQKAAGGGVGSLAPVARNMYKIPSVKRGVGSYISHMRR
jgi:hypothetical protein